MPRPLPRADSPVDGHAPPRSPPLQFELLQRQTLAHLEATIPYLGDYAVEDVAPVQQLLSEQTGQLSFEQATLAEVLDRNPGLETSQLGETDLGRFSLNPFPILTQCRLVTFKAGTRPKFLMCRG
jgi:hypothetical protein